MIPTAPPHRKTLSSREIDELRLRADSLCGAAPVMTADGFIWLHRALFVDVDPDAGNIRNFPLDIDGFKFARPGDIMPSLEERFVRLSDAAGFRSATADSFYRLLAHHIVELYAIHPFASGNRRTLGLHAMQLAKAAGVPVNVDGVRRVEWDRALDCGFCDGDSRVLARLIAGKLDDAEADPTDRWTGLGGMALLPTRYPPRGRRYLTPLARAREQLDDLMPAAIAEAEQILVSKPGNVAARQELAWLTHDKGPKFQLKLLESVNFGKIEVIGHQQQGPLERVREIGYGQMIGILQHPANQIYDAVRLLSRRRYAKGGSPHLDRMADQFLRNSRFDNENDLRFAPLQREFNEAIGRIALTEGGDSARIDIMASQLRLHLAERIRAGQIEEAAMHISHSTYYRSTAERGN